MQKTFTFRLLPSEAQVDFHIRQYIAHAAAVSINDVTGYHILKRSIDARNKQPFVNISALAFINEPFGQRQRRRFDYPDVHLAKYTSIIIGAGPAGLFAALRLIEAGVKPIVLERGKNIRARRRDLALLNKEGVVQSDSNYCFGEGGAGTYSDGKLYTRSNKRGDIDRILQIFYLFGAAENVLYDAHPHIGTNKLPAIISAMSNQIVAAGGELLFDSKVTDLDIRNDQVVGVKTEDGKHLNADAVVMATGHSARDVFRLLHNKKIKIEAKPFALGVRVEHPQDLINSIQYHCQPGECDPFLPPASYSLVQQVGDTGVFSFCMCPGGIIAPASTSERELVVNGWSPSKRNNPFANSGIVVQIDPGDVQGLRDFEQVMELPHGDLSSELGMMYLQQFVERKAFEAGGGKFVAPAQRLVDFCTNKYSQDLPLCSYVPGIHSTSLSEVLPDFIYRRLQHAFVAFGKKMRGRSQGYFTNDAIVVAAESRTSSPVRIPRHAKTLQHVQIRNFYPCGEGAGYAGGIVSAAMDGERVAAAIASTLNI